MVPFDDNGHVYISLFLHDWTKKTITMLMSEQKKPIGDYRTIFVFSVADQWLIWYLYGTEMVLMCTYKCKNLPISFMGFFGFFRHKGVLHFYSENLLCPCIADPP